MGLFVNFNFCSLFSGRIKSIRRKVKPFSPKVETAMDMNGIESFNVVHLDQNVNNTFDGVAYRRARVYVRNLEL